MLSILDRYFLRELGQTVGATVIVLLVIMAGTSFAHVLEQVAKALAVMRVMPGGGALHYTVALRRAYSSTVRAGDS